MRRKFESLTSSSGLGGLAAITRICLPGRALLPPGIGDDVVPVYDAEPTSIIAYCLASRQYQQQLNDATKACFADHRKRMAMAGDGGGGGGEGLYAGSGTQAAGGGGSSGAGTASLQFPTILAASACPSSFSYPEGAAGQASAGQGAGSAGPDIGSAGSGPGSAGPGCGSEGALDPDWVNALLLSPAQKHVTCAFEDEAPGTPWARARFQVTAYYAPQFSELRRRVVQVRRAIIIEGVGSG